MAEERKPNPEMVDQVATVLEVIHRPALRRAFLTDPERILRENGVDLAVFPKRLVDVLADMSYEELSVVARLHEECREQELVIARTTDGGVLCFV